MNKFKDLKVWQHSMDMMEEIYSLTSQFPPKENFSLTSQINRAAVSIPSNITEGAGRGSKPDFKRFLYIANGSSAELETLLILANKLNYIKKESLHKTC